MESDSCRDPNGIPNPKEEENPKNFNAKPKVVVIMGATGSGKSRLAIDLTSLFPIEIINADSMQDIGFCVEHTSFTVQKTGNFCTVMAGNYTLAWDNSYSTFFKKALVSRFLLDDSPVDTDELSLDKTYGDKQQPIELMQEQENFSYGYDNLKDLDPVTVNRIHPNDHRKINQYLHLYASSGVLPSKYLREKTMEIVQLTTFRKFEEALALFKLLALEDSNLRALKLQSIHIR
ncbi:unnamed protein product [Lactuca saligna]|uniref:Adenylate isopentenyltransferase n=1 Tax=Lactuca saligna TaxID=75948 RepID=A0AA36EA24_LACSI|nr:unnamed protein product [Lactuca saligna]